MFKVGDRVKTLDGNCFKGIIMSIDTNDVYPISVIFKLAATTFKVTFNTSGDQFYGTKKGLQIIKLKLINTKYNKLKQREKQ